MKNCIFVILCISLPNYLLEGSEKQRKWICLHGLFSKIEELDSYFVSTTNMLSIFFLALVSLFLFIYLFKKFIIIIF